MRDIEADQATLMEFYQSIGVTSYTELACHISDLMEEDGLDCVPEAALLGMAIEWLPKIAPDKNAGKLEALRLKHHDGWNDLLIDAVQAGDLWSVMTALDYADCNVEIQDGNLLHVALSYPGIVLALIEAGTSIHLMNADSMSSTWRYS